MKKFLKITLLACTVMTAPVGPSVVPSFASEETDLLTDILSQAQSILDEARNILADLGILNTKVETGNTLTETSNTLLTDISETNTQLVNKTEVIRLDTTQQLDAVTGPTSNIPHDSAYSNSAGGSTEGIKEILDSLDKEIYIGDDDLNLALSEYYDIFGLGYLWKFAEQDNTRIASAIIATSGVFSSSVGHVGYKRAMLSNQRLDDYMVSLKDSADIKSSIDLNTRVLLELVQQTNEILKVNSSSLSFEGSKISSSSFKLLSSLGAAGRSKYND